MPYLSEIKFWILLIFSVPSCICSILIFVYFARQKQMISLDHHLTLVLMSIIFLDITINFSFIINYYQHGRVFSSSNAFCTWWNWWEYSCNGTLLFVMAWGAIERHLLVFHRTLMATRRKRWIFHFLPMLIAVLYPTIFFFSVMVLNSCTNQWNYNEIFCKMPCYLIDQLGLATFNFISNIVFPVFTIALANLTLIVRVLRQKRHHRTAWRRQYKLTRHLISIAFIYMIFWFPFTINGLIITFKPLPYLINIHVNYFFFLLNMIPILLPFISLTSLSHFIQTVFTRQRIVITPISH